MNRVLVLVEGQTERGIFKQCFAPAMLERGISLSACVVRRRKSRRGDRFGGNSLSDVCSHLRKLLSEDGGRIVTMCFDYHGLDDWPGFADAAGAPNDKIPGIIESAFSEHLEALFHGAERPLQRFIPHIQMHEIESLFFTCPRAMAEVLCSEERHIESCTRAFAGIVKECGGCETINRKKGQNPSSRISQVCDRHNSRYIKGDSPNSHAIRIMRMIGLERSRQACPNFDKWIGKIEQLTRDLPGSSR